MNLVEDLRPRQMAKTPPEKLKHHHEALNTMFVTLNSALHSNPTQDETNYHSHSFYDEFNKTNDVVVQLMANAEWKDVFSRMNDRVDSKLIDIHKLYAELVSYVDNYLTQLKPVPASTAVDMYLIPLRKSIMPLLADLVSVYDEHVKKQSTVQALQPTRSAPQTLNRPDSLKSQQSTGENGEILPYCVFSAADLGPPTPRPNEGARPRSAHGQHKISQPSPGSPPNRAKHVSLPSAAVHALNADPVPYASSAAGAVAAGAQMSERGQARRGTHWSLASTGSMDGFVVIDEINSVAVERLRQMPPGIEKAKSDGSLMEEPSQPSQPVAIPPKLPPKTRGQSMTINPVSSAPNRNRQASPEAPPPLPQKKSKQRLNIVQHSKSFDIDVESSSKPGLYSFPPAPAAAMEADHHRLPAPPPPSTEPTEPDGFASLSGNRPQGIAQLSPNELAQLASSLHENSFLDRSPMDGDGHLLPRPPAAPISSFAGASPGPDILGTGLGTRHMSVLASDSEHMALLSSELVEEIVSSSSTTELESSVEVGSSPGARRRKSSQESRENSLALDAVAQRGRPRNRLPPSNCLPGVRARKPSPMTSDSDSAGSSPSRSPSPSPPSSRPSPAHSVIKPIPPPKGVSHSRTSTGSPSLSRRHTEHRSYFPRAPSPPRSGRHHSPSPPPPPPPESGPPPPPPPESGSPTVPPRHVSLSALGHLEARNVSSPPPPLPSREHRRSSEQMLSSPQKDRLAEPAPPPLPKKTKHLSQYAANMGAVGPPPAPEHALKDMDSMYGSVHSYGLALNKQALLPPAKRASTGRATSLYVAAASVLTPEDPVMRQRTRTVTGKSLARPPALPPKTKRVSTLVNGGDMVRQVSPAPPLVPPRSTLPRLTKSNTIAPPGLPNRASSANDIFAAQQQQQQQQQQQERESMVSPGGRRLQYSIPPPDIDMPPPPPPSHPPPPEPTESYRDEEGNIGSGHAPVDVTVDEEEYEYPEEEPEEPEEEEERPLFKEDIYKHLLFEESEEDSSDVVPLRGGTIEVMVSFAASASVVQAGELGKIFVNVFLQTHRVFLQPSKLLEMLLSRQEHFQKAATNVGPNSHQQTLFLIMRIIPLLRMKRQRLDGTELPSELEPEILNKLMATIYSLICGGQLKLALMLRSQLISKVTAPIKPLVLNTLLAETQDMKPVEGRLWRALMRFDPKRVAMQIALMNNKFYQEIDVQEIIYMSRKSNVHDVPTFAAYTEHLNLQNDWFATRILEIQKQRDRDKFMKFILKILKELVKLGNYPSAMNLYAAMKNSALYRLHWDSKVLERLESHVCEKLCEPTNNHKFYRSSVLEYVNTKTKPVMIFLNVIMSDLVYAHENATFLTLPDAQDDTKYLNYHKMILIYRIIAMLSDSQRKDYNSVYSSEKVLDIWNVFRGYQNSTSLEDLYDRSRQLVPEGRRF